MKVTLQDPNESLTPNLENIRKWVQGLRSDEFEQGQEHLASGKLDTNPNGISKRHPKKHCCLGVAAELALRDGVAMNVTSRFTGYNHRLDAVLKVFDGCSEYLPQAAQRWLGITDPNPLLPIPVECEECEEQGNQAGFVYREASGLNDGYVTRCDSELHQPSPRLLMPCRGRRSSFAEIADAIERKWLSGEEGNESTE